MSIFDELIKDKAVKDHPLLDGYKNIPKVREAMQRHAQEMESVDLSDMMTSGVGMYEESKDLNNMIKDATLIVSDVFNQFSLPVLPKIFFENSKDVKYARNDDSRVVEGSIIFGVELRSALGVRKRATIAVPISAGELVAPSIMEVDGSLEVISQSSLDGLLRRNNTYELPPLRESYQDPPLTAEEREIAVDLRNSQGYVPRKDPGSNYLNRKTVEANNDLIKDTAVGGVPRMYKQVTEAMMEAEDEGTDTFPRPYIYLLRNYILDFVSTASKDAWEPHLINEGFALNPYGMNRGRMRGNVTADFEKEVELEVEEDGVDSLLADPEEEMMDEKPGRGPRFYPETKTPIEPGDGIKFKGKGKDKSFQGTIVEVDEEGDFLIIKSKGMEYRVTVEDIEPVPSTFKKMYM